MPLFDRDALPTIPADTIATANQIYERLKSACVSEINLPETEYGFRVPNMVRSYFQAHLRRSVMFIEGGIAEIAAGRPLITELCTRAIYENIAAVCDFSHKLAALADKGDYDGISDFVTEAAFATRVPSLLEKNNPKAPQVLTQIDRMVKVYPEYRKSYDHLSDIVHPNGLGAVVYFANIEDGLITFADAGNNPSRALTSLLLAVILLLYFEVALAESEKKLKRLLDEIVAKHKKAEGG